MSTITNLSSKQLRRAADLKEKISALEDELTAVLGSAADVAESPVAGKAKKRKISAAGIARIKAAQKLRWAKYNKETDATSPAPKKKKKFTMSAAAKAKIGAAAKARWAKIKAARKA